MWHQPPSPAQAAQPAAVPCSVQPHLVMGEDGVELLQLLWSQLDGSRSQVLLQVLAAPRACTHTREAPPARRRSLIAALQQLCYVHTTSAGCALHRLRPTYAQSPSLRTWDGHHIRALHQHPGQGQLGGGGALALRHSPHALHQLHVLAQLWHSCGTVARKPGKGPLQEGGHAAKRGEPSPIFQPSVHACTHPPTLANASSAKRGWPTRLKSCSPRSAGLRMAPVRKPLQSGMEWNRRFGGAQHMWVPHQQH